MKDSIIIQGRTYISSRRASEITRYSNDYVGQLCRMGKVRSQKFGKIWFIEAESLFEHKKEADLKMRVVGMNAIPNSINAQKFAQEPIPVFEQNTTISETVFATGPLSSISVKEIRTDAWTPSYQEDEDILGNQLEVPKRIRLTVPASTITDLSVNRRLHPILRIRSVVQDIFTPLRVRGKLIATVLLLLVSIGFGALALNGSPKDMIARGNVLAYNLTASASDSIGSTISGWISNAAFAVRYIFGGVEPVDLSPFASQKENSATSTVASSPTPKVQPSSSMSFLSPTTTLAYNAGLSKGNTLTSLTKSLFSSGNNFSAFISDPGLIARVSSLESRLASAVTSQQSFVGYQYQQTIHTQSAAGDNISNAIKNISNSNISNTSISNSTITGSSFAGTTGIFSSDVTVGGTLTANGPFVATATSTFTGPVDFSGASVTGLVGGSGSSFNTIVTGPSFVATSTTATSTFAGNISVGGTIDFNGLLLQNGSPFVGSQWSTNASKIYYNTGNVGIGTTSPFAKLSVGGDAYIGGNLTATGTLVVAGASVVGATSTASVFVATSTTATSTFAGNISVAGNAWLQTASTTVLKIGSLTGPLQAVNGVVSASSTLSVAYGGTGISTIPDYGKVLLGNAQGGYDLVATSSLGITGGGGSGVWGGITGTLADQTDLQNALNSKFSLSNWYATTTDGLAQGLVNKYYSDTLVNAFIHASTTIPKTYSTNIFTGNNTFAAGVAFSSLGKHMLLATDGSGNVIASSTPQVASIIATSTTVASVFPKLRNGEIAIVHTDGSTSYTVATTSSDVGRGIALRTAMSTAVNGDHVYLSAGTFDVGTGSVDLTLGGLSVASIHGAGKYTTTITGSGSPLVKTSSDMDVTDMSIVTAGPGSFQIGLGVNSPGFSVYNVRIKNVYVRGYEDAIYFNVSEMDNLSIEDVSVTTSWDGIVVFSDNNQSTVTIKNTEVTSAIDANLFTPRRALSVSSGFDGMTVDVYNSNFTSDQYAVYTDNNTTVNLHGGSMVGSLGNMGSGSVVAVDPNTTFIPTNTSGTITYARPSVVAYNLANYSGNVGIGTTSPWRTLSVNGNSDLGTSALAGYFISTSSIASVFPYASTTALTVSGFASIGSLLVTGSSTLQNFTFLNATGTSATTTNFFATTASSTNLFTSLLTVGGNILKTLVNGNVGIGTTSPWRTLSVNGNSDLGANALAGYFTATSSTASVFPYASTTALTVSGTNGLSLGSLTGPLQAVNGAVSATSTLSTVYGGTGLNGFSAANRLLYSTSASTLAALTSANSAILTTNGSGVPTWSTTLPVANGGTGAGAQTTNGVVYYDGTSLTSSSQFKFNGTNVGISVASPVYPLDIDGWTLIRDDNRLLFGADVNNGFNWITNDSAGSYGFGVSTFTFGSEGKFSFIHGEDPASPISVILPNGQLGIKTDNPAYDLDVNGTIGNSNGDFQLATDNLMTWSINGGQYTITNTQILKNGDFSLQSDGGALNLNSTNGNTRVDVGTNHFYAGGDTKTFIDVGVDDSYMHLGDVSDGTYLRIDSANDQFTFNGGNVGISTTTPFASFAINPVAGAAANQFVVGSSTGTAFLINNSGYVGVGNLNPSENLDVNGNIRNLISSSALPVAKGSVTVGTLPQNVAIAGRYAYVTNYTSGSLQVIDATNPATMAVVGTVTGLSGPYGVFAAGRYVYVTNQSGTTLQAFDISNPVAPVSVGSVITGSNPSALYISGRYAYVVNVGNSKLEIFDIANPANMTKVGNITTNSTNPYGIYVSGRYAYVTDYVAATNQLQIFDVSDPINPIAKGTITTGTTPYNVTVSGRYAYVADYGSADFKVFDISNPSSIVLKSTVTTGTQPYNIAISGRYAFVSNRGSNTLQVFDISNPTSVSSLGTVATNSNTNGIALSGRTLYITSATGSNALQAFDIGGIETTAATIHSLTVGNASVNDDLFIGGRLNLVGGANIGVGGLFSAGSVGIGTNLSVLATSTLIGNVVIGTSTPLTATSSLLFVQATSTYQSNLFEVASSSGSSFFKIGNNGFVGVASSTPWAQLSINPNGITGPAFAVGSSTATKFIVTNGGNVGIGTTSPWRTLSVNGNSDLGANALAGYFTATSSTASVFPYASTTAITSSGSAYFATAGGNVGIGITSPQYKLDVNGTIGNSSGALGINSNGNTTVDVDTNHFYVGGDTKTFIDVAVDDNYMTLGNTSSGTYLTIDGAGGQSGFAGGNVGIGTTDPNNYSAALAITPDVGIADHGLYVESGALDALDVVGTATFEQAITIGGDSSINGRVFASALTNSGAGDYVCLTGGEVTYSTTACIGVSSQRFKHDITTLSASGLAQILALRPVSFVYNTDVSPGDQTTHLGFIAEEVAQINPHLAGYTKEGVIQSVKYDEFAPIFAQAIQEQQSQILSASSSISTLTVNQSVLASSTLAIQNQLSLLDPASSISGLSAQIIMLNNKFDDFASSTASIFDLASTTAYVASSTATSLASSTSFIQSIAQAVINLLQSSGQLITSAGNWTVQQVTATLATFQTLVAGRVETQTAAISNGLEMTDTASGQIYCVRITNGNWDKGLGPCAANIWTPVITTAGSTTTSSISVQPIITTPVSTTSATTSTPVASSASSTTSVTSTPTVEASIGSSTPSTTGSSTSVTETASSTTATPVVTTPTPEPVPTSAPVVIPATGDTSDSSGTPTP